METNQLAHRAPPHRVASSYHSIRVAYVHAIGVDVCDPFLPAIRDFCHEKKVYFTTREYAPNTYSEDCEFIERLPALQLYVRDHNQKTFYPNTRPYQIIDEVVDQYVRKEIAKKVANGAWKRRFDGFRNTIATFMHKKTRMETIEEETKKVVVRPVVYEPATPPPPSRKPKVISSA